jgi:hypothetical protein
MTLGFEMIHSMAGDRIREFREEAERVALAREAERGATGRRRGRSWLHHAVGLLPRPVRRRLGIVRRGRPATADRTGGSRDRRSAA